MDVNQSASAAQGASPSQQNNATPMQPKPRSHGGTRRKLKKQKPPARSTPPHPVTSDKSKVASALFARNPSSMAHIQKQILRKYWEAEAILLPPEQRPQFMAEMEGLQKLQKLILEGRRDDLNKFSGICGSYTEITDSVDKVIEKSNQCPGKPKIHQQLQQIKGQPLSAQLKTLKSIALELSDTLQRKSKKSLTQIDKNDFHIWFRAIMHCMLKINDIEQPSDSIIQAVAGETLHVFQIMINRQLADPDLIPYVLLAKTLEKLYTLSINQSVARDTRARLTTVIKLLCERFENTEISKTPAFVTLRKQLLTIHLKSLNPSGIHLPSNKTMEIISDLIEMAPTKENRFLFLKYIVNFHGLVDFGGEEQIRQHITKNTTSDVSDALMAYLDGNIEAVCALDSQNPMIIWLQATIALNHQFDSEKCEQLLTEAANRDEMMNFDLALFYLEHCQSPGPEKLATIKSLLVTSELKIHEAERSLWLQCNAKVNQFLLLEEENKIASGRNYTLPTNHPEKKEGDELIAAEPSGSSAIQKKERTKESPLTDLSSVMSLAEALIKKYQYQHDVTSFNSEAVREFTVIGCHDKKLTPFEAMKPENRNPVINKLLRHIHICRVFNNLEEEVRCYDILKNQKFMFMLQFERLLEEATWTLLHCIEDPHSGGFRSTQKERLAALNLAKQLMIICLQHTVKQPGIVFDTQRVSERIEALCEWLDNIDNFGGDQQLQQYMRHNIRCRAGSGLGHIFRFIQEETKRSELEKLAFMYFQAKTAFDPGYKPEPKGHMESREQYYRQVTLAR
ncbi:hypothetical protein [Endozoicomonas sp. SCSIO W0465]|uniref:hypothetical protein n=1 Tax=Endozoicomonas sp. SCSIO W0465 TaxID=2918516 RepID=UPI002075C3B1|nr:hypothetical protein [Endozoicomonas sp. SCSIO W0465]USE34917.1 hypothetical protein MJO57_22745 [Endozoicomonas sp. SCSIO W0465]